MLFDWFLSRRELIAELDECSRHAAKCQEELVEAQEVSTMQSIQILDLKELLERALRAGENLSDLNRVILSGDPGDETSVP